MLKILIGGKEARQLLFRVRYEGQLVFAIAHSLHEIRQLFNCGAECNSSCVSQKLFLEEVTPVLLYNDSLVFTGTTVYEIYNFFNGAISRAKFTTFEGQIWLALSNFSEWGKNEDVSGDV